MNLDKYVPVGIDSETIPTQNVDTIEMLKVTSAKDVVLPSLTKTELLEALKGQPYPLGGLKVDELKKLWMDEFGGPLLLKEFEKAYRRTSFDAVAGGEVVAVAGHVFGINQTVSNYRWLEQGTPESNMLPVPSGPTEAELIDKFFRWLENANDWARGQSKQLLLVGANVRNFDMKFLARRALYHNVDLPNFGICDTSYISRRYFDVIEAFGFYDRGDKTRYSLKRICDFLGIESPKVDEFGEIDGSMVWDIWANNGKDGAERISKYCARDAVVLEPIFNKLHWLVE